MPPVKIGSPSNKPSAIGWGRCWVQDTVIQSMSECTDVLCMTSVNYESALGVTLVYTGFLNPNICCSLSHLHHFCGVSFQTCLSAPEAANQHHPMSRQQTPYGNCTGTFPTRTSQPDKGQALFYSSQKNKTNAMSPPRQSNPSPDVNRRMQALLTISSNMVCVDCPIERPRWVSLLYSSVHKGERVMGVFCCNSCAQHHRFTLGAKRCTVKHLKTAQECEFRMV